MLVNPPANQESQPSPQVRNCYLALLGLAEFYRKSSPPNIRLAIHCLKAILCYKLPSSPPTPDDLIKFEAADLLADFFERKGKRYAATCILNDTRIIPIGTAGCYSNELDMNSACELLARGSEFAQRSESEYTRGLFLLSKCMLLLASRQLPEVTNTLTVANRLIENLKGANYQREALRLFYLINHVSLFLLADRAKSALPILKQLQQSIQYFASLEENSHFCPIPPGLLTATVCVYQYSELCLDDQVNVRSIKEVDLLTVFELSLLEHTIMCRLVMGKSTKAVEGVGLACRICHANLAPMHRRRPQLHTLIGLYAKSMKCMNQAEKQFNLALRNVQLSPSNSTI
ncbi:hypothetical protein Aperf_G00000126993 [Anoplocephala perfoliata]